MFTKQHYEAVAETLRMSNPGGMGIHNKDAIEHWRITVQQFIAMFNKDNPKFNATRFMEACRYTA